MNSSIIVNSLGVGGIIFMILLMVWFVAVYMKRRVGAEPHQAKAAPVQKTNWEEKRRQARVAVSWGATIESGAGTVDAQIKDVSQGGAFVVCRHPLPLTSRLRITVDYDSQAPLSLNAEVVWSNANVPADKIINRGMGIRFIDNEQSERERLGRLIAACFGEK